MNKKPGKIRYKKFTPIYDGYGKLRSRTGCNMMTDDQLTGRLQILVEKMLDDNRILNDDLKEKIILHTIGFMNLFGYYEVPFDFIKVEFIDGVIDITLAKKYLNEWGLITL